MFCVNCGKEIPDGSPFCRFCGASQLDTSAYQEPVNPAPEQPQYQQNPYAQNYGNQNASQGNAVSINTDQIKNSFSGYSFKVFNNSGDKLHLMSFIVFIIGVVTSLFKGIGIIVAGFKVSDLINQVGMMAGSVGLGFSGSSVSVPAFFVGLFTIIFGSIISYVIGLAVYAFGDIVLNADTIAANTKPKE